MRGINPADLDRCEHGRHSIDECYGCPAGRSTGNEYLAVYRDESEPVYDAEVRIGTTIGGDPITVVPVRRPRTDAG